MEEDQTNLKRMFQLKDFEKGCVDLISRKPQEAQANSPE